jgi:hypothetical protein
VESLLQIGVPAVGSALDGSVEVLALPTTLEPEDAEESVFSLTCFPTELVSGQFAHVRLVVPSVNHRCCALCRWGSGLAVSS